jgi:hypothetical protein
MMILELVFVDVYTACATPPMYLISSLSLRQSTVLPIAHKNSRPDDRRSTLTDCAKETSGGTLNAVSVNCEASVSNLCLGSSGGQRSMARGSGGAYSGAIRGINELLVYAIGPCQFDGGLFGRGKTKGGGWRGRRAFWSPCGGTKGGSAAEARMKAENLAREAACCSGLWMGGGGPAAADRSTQRPRWIAGGE